MTKRLPEGRRLLALRVAVGLVAVYLLLMSTATRLLPASGGSGGFRTMPDQGVALPGTFTKSLSNPILSRGAAGTWDDGEIDGEAVFYDGINGRFVMVYSANDGTGSPPYFKTGLAYSSDLLAWTKEATNPVFDPGYKQVAPTIVRRGSQYVMYYQKWPGTSEVYCATSTDLLSWTVQNGGSPVLPVRAGEWDETHTFDPNVRLRDDGTIQLFYAGQDHFGSRAVGYAYSSDNVTMTNRTFVAYWDMATEVATNWGTPSVIASNDNRWGMFVDASAVADNRFIDRLYTTDNGASFTREAQVLTKSVSGWDSGQVFDAAAIWWNGTLYLFYTGTTVTGGSSGLASDIGLATMSWPR